MTGLWVALRCPVASTRGLDACVPGLPVGLGGVITVGGTAPAWATLAVPADPMVTDGWCLAAALRALPSTAAALAWCTLAAPAVSSVGVADLWRRIGTSDAVMAASLVTDAVKQVRDGRIHRGVDRDGLCVPMPPVVVRTPAPQRLLTALDAGHDPIAAIAAAHLDVRIVQWPRPGFGASRSTGTR